MRSKNNLEVTRHPDQVKVVIRPFTGRAVALGALAMMVAMAARAILSPVGAGEKPWAAVILPWSIPFCILLIYVAWRLCGRQEITVTEGEIRTKRMIGPIAVGIPRALRRQEIVAVRYLEGSKNFRGGQFINRRLVLSDIAGESIATIGLPNQSTALRICSELGLVDWVRVAG